MTTTTTALSPFDLAAYFRDHAPAAARSGMRGYVLRLLIDMARLKGSERGTCWPSVTYLAGKIGRSARQVQRLLRELETLGEVERIVQRRQDGGQSSNLYRLRGLIGWASKRVTPPGDSRARQTPTGRIKTPARGVKSDFRKAQAASQRHAPASAPADRAGYAKTGLNGVLSDPVGSAPKWRALSAAQVEEARSGCDPIQWERLRLAAGIDGVGAGDLDAAAAHRWRAGAILRGVQLVA